MGRADYLALGDYNCICYECGRKRKASEMKKHWQGYWVCPEHWEPRQQQDYVRAVPEVITPPWTQPPSDAFLNNCTPDSSSAYPGLAGPGCVMPDFVSYFISEGAIPIVPTPEPFVDCDPYWDNVVLAMHMDDAGLTDEKGHFVNIPGSVAFEPSGLAGGAMSSNNVLGNLFEANSADFALGTGDFTIETWVFLITAVSDIRIWQPNGGVVIPAEIQAGTRQLSAYNAGALSGGSAVPLNQWVHIAFSRQSGVLYAALDGVVQWSLPFTYNFTETLWVAYSNSAGNLYLMDDVLVTESVARYTTDFTPPTAPFADIAC